MVGLNPLHANDFFLYTLKTKKTFGFLMFTGGTEKGKRQWYEIGKICLCIGYSKINHETTYLQ